MLYRNLIDVDWRKSYRNGGFEFYGTFSDFQLTLSRHIYTSGWLLSRRHHEDYGFWVFHGAMPHWETGEWVGGTQVDYRTGPDAEALYKAVDKHLRKEKFRRESRLRNQFWNEIQTKD